MPPPALLADRSRCAAMAPRRFSLATTSAFEFDEAVALFFVIAGNPRTHREFIAGFWRRRAAASGCRREARGPRMALSRVLCSIIRCTGRLPETLHAIIGSAS